MHIVFPARPIVRHWKVFLILILPLGVGVGVSIGSAMLRNRPYQQVDLGALGAFPFDDQHGGLQDVPEDFRRLDGKKVVVGGMLFIGKPDSRRASRFQLVEVGALRPHSPPRVQERIFVQPPVAWVPPAGMPSVRVFGTIHVSAKRDLDGTVISLYELDADRIVPGVAERSPPYWLWGLSCSLALAAFVVVRRQLQLRRYKVRVANGLCVNCG